MNKTAKIFFSGMAFLLLALCSTTFTARAQGGSFASRLGYSAALMAEGFGEDHSFATLDLRIKYAVSPSFSVFVPLDCSELLYNKTTTKNFDFAVRSGAGVRAGHEFASGDVLAGASDGGVGDAVIARLEDVCRDRSGVSGSVQRFVAFRRILSRCLGRAVAVDAPGR